MAEDMITQTIGNMGAGILNTGVVLVIILIVSIMIIGIIFGLRRIKMFNQYDVEIWQLTDTNQLFRKSDKAGVFIDKTTKRRQLWLKNHKVPMDPDKITYIIGNRGRKKIYMLQIGQKSFRYLTPKFMHEQFNITVGEEDVNWAVNEIEKTDKAYTNNLIAQWGPVAVQIFAVVAVLIIVMFLIQQLSDLVPAIEKLASNINSIKASYIPTSGGGS